MPALSVTSLDRFIEPSSSSSKEPSSSSAKETASSTDGSTPFSFYPPLYATPSQQRPPSPSSFSPSPYVLNFKRRGRVQQQLNVGKESTGDTSTSSSLHEKLRRMDPIEVEGTAATSAELNRSAENADFSLSGAAMARKCGGVFSENEVFEMELDKRDASKNVPTLKTQGFVSKDTHFCSDFSSRMGSGTGNVHPTAPCSVSSFVSNEEVEFFDAPDSVFSDSATEDEVCSLTGKPGRGWVECHGRTASILEEEIARRIKAEETVSLWQRRWNDMAKCCSSIGLSLSFKTGEVLGNIKDSFEVPVPELLVARLVGGAIASAVVKAEKDEEFESMLGVKNREISRLCDKLQYLELVNREMSQRNQEVIELTQRRRKRLQRRRKLALGFFCGLFCIGTAGLACYQFVPWDQVKGLAKLFETSSTVQTSSGDICKE